MTNLRRYCGLLLFCSVAHLPAVLAAVPQKPLLKPQTLHTDDMVLAESTASRDPAEALARYLRVLAENPRDLEALTGAGRAALDIGDPNAAISFYARAEEVSPRDGRIKAGLGSAMVQLVQPRAALRLFEEAVQYGVPAAEIASDRGLAYALRGDSKRARADFDLALSVKRDPETVRRLALTQAIDGDAAGAMATLDPLLRRQDKAAWRARVFALAISGDVKTAQTTADAMLPKQQAEALAPFLDRIGKLKPSQQAAAVHFGQFPADGRRYSEAELFAAAGSAPPLSVTPRQAPAPSSGDAMADDQGDGVDDAHPAHATPAKTKAAKQPASPAPTAKKPDIWASTERSPFRLIPIPAKKPPVAATAAVTAAPAAMATPAATAAAADQMTSATTQESPAPQPPTVKKEVLPPAKKAADLQAAGKQTGADKDSKARKDSTTREARGKETKAKDAKAETAAKAATSKSKQPERHWVQVATGAYKPDLGKAWGKLKEKYPALLGKRSAWTTPLNRTNRVLVGPFKTSDEAQAFVNKAAGGGFMTSPFTSPAGQAVEPIK